MSKIVVIGQAGVSILIPNHEAPDTGDYRTISAVNVSTGGRAVTTAITLERLGVATAFVGVLGDDLIGTEIRAKLDDNGTGDAILYRLSSHGQRNLTADVP